MTTCAQKRQPYRKVLSATRRGLRDYYLHLECKHTIIRSCGSPITVPKKTHCYLCQAKPDSVVDVHVPPPNGGSPSTPETP